MGVTKVQDQSGAVLSYNTKLDAAGQVTAVLSLDGTRPTYRYSASAFSMVATPTAVVVIQGSAAKVGLIKRIAVAGAATAAGAMACFITRRSTAGTLGSAVLTAVAAAKHDINDPTANMTVSTVGTANYTTLGTTAGVLAAGRMTLVAIGSAATSGEGKPLVFEFAPRSSKSWTLRGTSDFITVDFGGAAIPAGGVLDFEIEIEEAPLTE